jgi:pyridoxal/pyridoxine/pyridoxamine kinase
MGDDQADDVVRMVQEQDALEARMDADALIQGYLGPDHKVLNMADFYSALVQALKTAREQGHADNADGDVLTLI